MGVRETFGTDVPLTGWGHSPFGKLTDETLESLIVSVATEAMTSAGIEPGQVDEIYVGQFNSGLLPQNSLAAEPAPSRVGGRFDLLRLLPQQPAARTSQFDVRRR